MILFLISFRKRKLDRGMEGGWGRGTPQPSASCAGLPQAHLPLHYQRQDSGRRVWRFIDTNTKAASVMGWYTEAKTIALHMLFGLIQMMKRLSPSPSPPIGNGSGNNPPSSQIPGQRDLLYPCSRKSLLWFQWPRS